MAADEASHHIRLRLTSTTWEQKVFLQVTSPSALPNVAVWLYCCVAVSACTGTPLEERSPFRMILSRYEKRLAAILGRSPLLSSTDFRNEALPRRRADGVRLDLRAR